MLPPGIRHRAVGHNEYLQRSVQTGKPSSQQVFWHSSFGFFLSFLHCFLHFAKDFLFFSHFVILIFLHLLLLKPLQGSTLGSAGGGSGNGGAEGGSGSHKPQVFLHFCNFAAL